MTDNRVREVPIVSLDEALREGSAMFAGGTIKEAPATDPDVVRLRHKLTTIFEKLPRCRLGEKAIVHSQSGLVFNELIIDRTVYLVGCGETKGTTLQPGRQTDIITGSCLFGSEAIVGHAESRTYSLTDPHAIRNLKEPIETISVDTRQHVYEAEAVARLSMFVEDLASQLEKAEITVHVHVPVPEYEIYGLSLYCAGKMTREIFEQYREAVRQRGRLVEALITGKMSRKNVRIVAKSPLNWLDTFDVFGPKPEELARRLCIRAREYNGLWYDLIGEDDTLPLSELNHLSYIYSYLATAKQAAHLQSQVLFVEDPDEAAIYYHALKAQERTGIYIDKMTGLYVHPRVAVKNLAFPNEDYVLFNCKDGCEPETVDMTLRLYER
ncbi:MAG TPA: hypothetical protein VGS28_04130 [Candidatus Saccharimonadales bacterium]|nr:hypothetical protein [Candidatus Saccharimonadales bacterium]